MITRTISSLQTCLQSRLPRPGRRARRGGGYPRSRVRGARGTIAPSLRRGAKRCRPGGSARRGLPAFRSGAPASRLAAVHLAGAFGNYLNVESARRIGMLEAPASLILPAGNASLRGVKMALLSPSRREPWIEGIRRRAEHVALASEVGFEDTFVGCLSFE